MLRQASLAEVKAGRISRAHGRIVIAMRFYPRGLAKKLQDEYLSVLAPDPKLLHDFLQAKKELGQEHNRAFETVRYEARFQLSDAALEELKRLSKLSHKQDVYLVCQCGEGERCHRDLLLLLARMHCGAQVEAPRFRYELFEKWKGYR